jgi:pimeloyl-ACP methyl ester carboxylesterase
MNFARSSALMGGVLLPTHCGPIEYAEQGSGMPVLSIHGTGGGWDQGLSIARGLVDHGYRVIAPSRFGYLRTAMPAKPSPSAEADFFACFLDALKINRVSVIAASAGATPALQFALRHPDRVSSLVLLVPAVGGISPADTVDMVPPFIMRGVLASDFLFWGAMKAWPSVSYSIVAVPKALVPTLAPDDRAHLDEAIAQILPVTWRRKGILYDAWNQRSAPVYPLEKISAPTLVVSAEDDLYRTLPNARVAAARIPGAQLITYHTGGHLLLGHGDELWPVVADFMRR